MYYVVTGAAGFIGSNLVQALNARGERNIIAVDDLAGRQVPQSRRLRHRRLHRQARIPRGAPVGRVRWRDRPVLHQGACSDTMETDGRYMMENNYRYSLALLEFCIDEAVPLIYASSASVYGGGSVFREERSCEAPLNIYGYSKFLFDQAVRRRMAEAGAQVAGFRYFNVYGPNEWHKERMASVAWHFFNQYRADKRVRPFQGSGGYGDGEQRRDFISVEDVVKVNMFFLDRPELSGIFNVGTGRAQTFNDTARAVVNACREAEGQPPLSLEAMQAERLIDYTPFPEALRGKYQHFTQADVAMLRRAGYEEPFLPVEEGVARYCKLLLSGGQ